MMFSTNNLLFIISSALLASGYVVERGYTPPVGINYCQDLVSHLNTRYNANILPEKCASSLEPSNGGIELLDPAELECHDLVEKARERGVLVDVSICPVDGGENRSDDLERKHANQCREIVRELQQYSHKIQPEVCIGRVVDLQVSLLGDDDFSENDFSEYDCSGLVQLLHDLGVRVNEKVCDKRSQVKRARVYKTHNTAPPVPTFGPDSKCRPVHDQLTAGGFLWSDLVCVEDATPFDSTQVSDVADHDFCQQIKTKLKANQIPVKYVACMGKPVVYV
ncbi:hypothetical protein K7432_013965 [Basidiobolus ranarum]|uniref:Secreted protein n=1 Tax=Basidiobolus ranarum TaxID=34480 RepID=A0ABR2WIB5_9FUNG